MLANLVRSILVILISLDSLVSPGNQASLTRPTSLANLTSQSVSSLSVWLGWAGLALAEQSSGLYPLLGGREGRRDGGTGY